MKITTWNVNSVGARLQHLRDYLQKAAPDVALLQELKCVEEAFPRMEIEDLGYNIALSGQKSYNGVAILSKHPIEDITTKLPGDDSDVEARYIEAVVKNVRVASVYVPNGMEVGHDKFQYKLRFLKRLREHFGNLLQYDEKFVAGGDYNVAPEDIDVYDAKKSYGSICFHPDERAAFRGIMNMGLTDAFRAANENVKKFSWWDYRAGAWQNNIGLRIDHLLLSPEAADKLVKCEIDVNWRALDKPSDHTPVWCELKGADV